MRLSIIKNKYGFKKELTIYVKDFLGRDPVLENFIVKITDIGELYIIGGFIRDFANQKASRDMDVITVIRSDLIQTLVETLDIPYKRNRHDGFKLTFKEIEVDIWSLSDNWAFKMQFIKSDPKDVRSIARGAFFNFDALVFSLNAQKISVDSYNNCIQTYVLDILQKSSKYRGYNPTREANILRAFYLHKKYQLNFSSNLAQYIKEHLYYYVLKYGNAVEVLLEYLKMYPKYSMILNEEILNEYCDRILNGDGFMKVIEDKSFPILFEEN